MATSSAKQRPPLVGAAVSRRCSLWSHPVVLFLTAGVLTVAVLLVVLSAFSTRAATDQAILDARAVTEVVAHSVAEPAIPVGLVAGEAASVDRFDRTMLSRLLVDRIVRIKIWDRNGKIIYSDKVQLIGETFGLDDEELNVVAHGGSAADVSDLQQPENRYERSYGKLLEVYIQVHAPSGQPLLFEAYFPYSDVSQRSAAIASDFRPITVAGLVLFLLLTCPLVWILARRLDRSAADRERLLLAAVEASDIERRRIARDLHDGVVQELAGISFTLSATARQLHDQPQTTSTLDALGAGVRRSLRALRSLLVEIYPPDLRTQGLPTALDDLLAPAAAAGIDVSVEVADTSHVAPDQVALVWRGAQEAIRNAIRHGRPRSLSLRVSTPPGGVELDVRDDGVGFDPAVDPPYGHFGLRSLRDLVEEAGGTLEISSSPYHGTTFCMTLGET